MSDEPANCPIKDVTAYQSGGNKIVRDRVFEILGQTGKYAGPAILALCVMWVKIQSHDDSLKHLDTERDSQSVRLLCVEKSLIEVRAAQGSDNREIFAAIRRLEDVTKEIRTDVKELQRRP